MRIFMGLNEIAGYFSNLKKGFNELGIDCTFVSLEEHPFQYGCDEEPTVLVKYLKKIRSTKKARNIFMQKFKSVLLLINSFLFLCWTMSKYDVFVFGFNSTFYKYYDLPILKLFNKKIIFIFFGSDSRPPYISGKYFSSNKSIDECIINTRQKKEIIKKIEKYADVIINSPPQAFFHERPFILGAMIGFPFESSKVLEGTLLKPEKKISNECVRILHAPSNPVVKGTEKIRRIIERLKDRGYEIDFIEIIGRPHHEVILEIMRCDFVITQMYSDAPMPGFATEASYFGKPALLGGYYAAMVDEDIPKKNIPPSVFCHPDKVEETVEKLIVDKEYRLEMGKKARNFIRQHRLPKKVAEHYLKLITGEIPDEWYYNPQRIRYLHGSGISEDNVKKVIRDVINKGGVEALQISDKPELEKLLMEFAGIEDGEQC